MKYSLFLLALLIACSGQDSSVKKSETFSVKTSGCAPVLTGDYLTDKPAPRIPGLEYFNFRVSTGEKDAQFYFNQGWALAAGFNHAEAARSFYWATQVDPDCAMCYWGLAYVLGPNYNAGMAPEVVSDAHEAITTAQLLSGNCNEKERDLISAMAVRYPNNTADHTSASDSAYSQALKILHKKYPKDNDIAALYAESIMDLHPWQLWDDQGQPYEWTAEILTVLEGIRQRNPGHAIGNHMYIHAVEASKTPQLGNEAALFLETSVPGAGHLVHMPSHIYIRTGEYNACSRVNEQAISVDSIYVSACHAAGAYPLGYYPHNFHFLCACAALEGKGSAALEASLRMQEKLDTVIMKEDGWGTVQHYYTIPWYIMVKFEMWDEILSIPKPNSELKYPLGVWHYSRGLARAAYGKYDLARRELEELQKLSSDPAIEKITIWDINSAVDLLGIATHVLSGEISRVEGNASEAEKHFLLAIEIEDNLNYNEPPDWFFSVRHYLGDLMLDEERWDDAMEIYETDLANFPANGWALNGLYRAYIESGDSQKAEDVLQQLKEAWNGADIELKGSRVL